MLAKQKPLLRLKLQNELDVVLAQKRARDCAQLLAMGVPTQIKFATAVSEMCRNVVEHVGVGEISFGLLFREGQVWLEAIVTDHGRGIGDPEYWLHTPPRPGRRGYGIYNSRRLVDDFELHSSETHGTRAILRLRLAARLLPSDAQIQDWRQRLTHDTSVSPYEELKQQNDQLVLLYEELREKNQQTEQQVLLITRLNTELAQLNAANEQLLTERQKRNQFLQNLNTELDAFAHTVSHDLKAPLYNIQGLVMLLADDLQQGDMPAVTYGVELLQQQTTWMNRLIEGILEYARAGREPIARTRVSTGELVVRVLQSLRVPTGMQIHLAPDLPTLLTEAIYLQQVFSNLLSNALKYHDQPTGNVWVTVGPSTEAGMLEFCVADDGPGIKVVDQLRLFEIFQVASSRATSDSTGIGLAIVQKIVRDKGGRAWVESAGRGSFFRFTWPLAEVVPMAS